jgi:hypothetical protein
LSLLLAGVSIGCPLLLTGSGGNNLETGLFALGATAGNCPELTGVTARVGVGSNLALGDAELDNTAAGLSAFLGSAWSLAAFGRFVSVSL